MLYSHTDFKRESCTSYGYSDVDTGECAGDDRKLRSLQALLDAMTPYSYVGNDPVNFIDPLGLQATRNSDEADDEEEEEVVVTGRRRRPSPTPQVGFGGGGGSFGGGGGSGSWGPPVRRPVPIIDEGETVVVTAPRPRRVPPPVVAPPPNRIFFGYPPEPNSRWHFDRHLQTLTSRERRRFRQQLGRDVRATFPVLRPGQRGIGFFVFNGEQYQYVAYGLPGGITNIGTLRHVRD